MVSSPLHKVLKQRLGDCLSWLLLRKSKCHLWEKWLGIDMLEDSSSPYVLGLFGLDQLADCLDNAGLVDWEIPWTCVQKETNSECSYINESARELACVCLNLVCHSKSGPERKGSGQSNTLGPFQPQSFRVFWPFLARPAFARTLVLSFLSYQIHFHHWASPLIDFSMQCTILPSLGLTERFGWCVSIWRESDMWVQKSAWDQKSQIKCKKIS